ncbi:MAG: GNAT family N-acetyltransferase [Kiritimatiellia bacterium]
MPIEVREWDSRFFGYPVASVSFASPPRLDPDVHSALREARNQGVRLLYLAMPPVPPPLRLEIQQAGATFAGRKCEYGKPIAPSLLAAGDDGISICRENSPALEQLALQSGAYSRFRVDRGFQHNEFERLYREWLASSLRGDGGKRVYVAGAAAAPMGLITLEPSGTARIGLLAVAEQQRGRGIGRRLMAKAEQVSGENRQVELRVATQAENREACRFYESCGFRKIAETDCFHAWLHGP